MKRMIIHGISSPGLQEPIYLTRFPAVSCSLTTSAATRLARGLRLRKLSWRFTSASQMDGVTDEVIGNRSDHQYRQRVVRGKPVIFQCICSAFVLIFVLLRLPLKDAHFWGQGANPVFSRVNFPAVTAYPVKQKSGENDRQRAQLYIIKSPFHDWNLASSCHSSTKRGKGVLLYCDKRN